MVDIHSHILPGLDDGSKSLDESLEMLELAAAGGTTDIVATPHANSDYSFNPAIIAERLSELRAANRTEVRIHSGCDFHLDFDQVQDSLLYPCKYTINGGPYLLIELPEQLMLRSVSQILDNLMRCGMTPILTHPERYRALQGKMEQVAEWVSGGCLVQVTAQSVLGVFGSTARKFSENLLDRDIVHFIASDAHDTKARTPRLDESRRWIADRYGEDRALRLFEANPRATLGGDSLPTAATEKKSRRWLPRWGG